MAVQALGTSLNSLIPSLGDGIKGIAGVRELRTVGGSRGESTSRVDRLKDREAAEAPRGLTKDSRSIVRQVNVSEEEVEPRPEDNAGIGRRLDVFA